jgi:hypothetical protein
MTRLIEGRNARSRPARSPPDKIEPVTEVVTYSESSRPSRWAAAVDLVQQVRGVVSFTKAATCNGYQVMRSAAFFSASANMSVAFSVSRTRSLVARAAACS